MLEQTLDKANTHFAHAAIDRFEEQKSLVEQLDKEYYSPENEFERFRFF